MDSASELLNDEVDRFLLTRVDSCRGCHLFVNIVRQGGGELQKSFSGLKRRSFIKNPAPQSESRVERKDSAHFGPKA